MIDKLKIKCDNISTTNKVVAKFIINLLKRVFQVVIVTELLKMFLPVTYLQVIVCMSLIASAFWLIKYKIIK